MNTVIEIVYKNYTENVIVTEENVFDVATLLFSDKDVVDYNVVVVGDVVLDEQELFEMSLDYKRPSKANTFINMESKLTDLESVGYFASDREAISHRTKIENLSKRLEDKKSKLTNLERLYI